MAETMRAFRELLKPKTSFRWGARLDDLFEHFEHKPVIISQTEKGLRIFDPNRTTCLATDWSRAGIGFWLLQKHCACPEPIPFCSRDGWKTTWWSADLLIPVSPGAADSVS